MTVVERRLLRLERLEHRNVPNGIFAAAPEDWMSWPALDLAMTDTSSPCPIRDFSHSTPIDEASAVEVAGDSSAIVATPATHVERASPAPDVNTLQRPVVMSGRPGFDPGGRSLTYVDASNGLQTPTMEGGNTEIEFGDVNNDGYVDIVSIGDHGSPYVNTQEHGVMVWFGDRFGNWTVHQNGNFGYGGVALGDVNFDGKMDIGYAMHHDYSTTDFGDQLIEVALGDGTGKNWTPWDDGLATNGEDYGMFETDLADIDNDGDLDVGSLSFGCCSGIHVYRNNGDGTWTQSFGFVGGNTRNNFVFGDVNGDGNADIAVGHSFETIYFGDGSGGFQPADGNLPPPGNIGRIGTSLGDVNGDGRDDLAAVSSSGGLAVWTWVSDGNWQGLSNGLPSGGSHDATQIADMNLDGHGDLVAFANGVVEIYAGDGAGNWSLPQSFATPGVWDFAAFRAGTDVDHNGYPDIGEVAAEGTTGFNAKNRPRVYVESSIPSEPAVHPQSPRGGETYVAGSMQFIDWSAAVPSTIRRTTISIEVSVTGANGPWLPVANHVKNNGRYQWLIPNDLPMSARCHLRFTMHAPQGDTVGVTSEPFRIVR